MSSIKPVAWFTEDHLTDLSATTYDTEVVERWRHKGWPVSGLVLHSDHEAEVARLRAELQNAAKAALDAVALSCAKEREADALRVDAMRYRWLRDRSGSSPTPSEKQPAAWIEGPGNLFVESDWLTGERADRAIDAAMGASA